MRKILSFMLFFVCFISLFFPLFSNADQDFLVESESIQQENTKNTTQTSTNKDENYFSNLALSDEERHALMHKKIFSLIERHKLRGANLVVAHKGKIIYSCNHGFLDNGRKHPIDENSLLRCASVTKFIAALGLYKLYDEGKLDLDRDISDYFGVKLGNPKHPTVPLTARQLMTHTSSISNGSAFNFAKKSIDKVIGADSNNAKNFFNARPGTLYKYKNLNGGMFGAIIEAISKQSLQDYMQENIFSPMGMEAYFNLTLIPNIDFNRISNLYMKDGRLLKTAKSVYKAANGYNNTSDPLHHYNISIGALWTNANHLIKPLIMLCNQGIYNGKRYLKEETVACIIKDQSSFENSSVTLQGGKYGLSVERMLDIGKNAWYGHQGRFEGTLSAAYFEPESRTCFALITNRWDNKMQRGIASFSRKLVGLIEQWIEDGTVK